MGTGPALSRRVVFEKLRGVWRTRGYGQILDIEADRYTLYEETSVSCLPIFEGSLDDLAGHYVDVRMSPGGQAFSARRTAGLIRLKFRRLSALPPRGTITPKDNADPLYNFDVLWHTFAEHYALFELRGVDWPSVYEHYRPRIEAGVSPQALFHILAEALQPLRDGHVHLHTPHGRFSAAEDPPLFHRLAKELDVAEDSRDVLAYLAELREGLRDTIRENYLNEGAQRTGNRLLEWGGLAGDSAGYLAIRAMAGLSGKSGHPGEDLDAVDGAMPRIMADLSEYPAITIDLRVNGGGYDAVAMRLASYFIDRKRLAFSKAARSGEGYTGRQRVYVEPRESKPYKGELVLLTSGLTASAAEVFILALLQRPGVTLVGEPTQGILSDAMERHLPNEWFVTLSNELYLAADGELYEDRGIPPHVEIPFLRQKDRESERDGMLDYVLDMAQ